MRATAGRYRAMLAVVGVIALAALGCAAALWPRGDLPKPGFGGQGDSTQLVSATLTKVTHLDCPEADSHGTGPKTTAAVVGTALALGLTAALAIAFVAAASLTGLASEEAQNANFAVGGLSLRGLLLAGIIIGGLGVLDDVTMSQASLVTELHQANPSAGMAELVGGALRVGRDHIAATVNTLFLAYAGAALPLLILFVAGTDSLGTVATTELVAVEIVRALCGSVGLIAAVPLTTVLAALVATEAPRPGQTHAIPGGRHAPQAGITPPADVAAPAAGRRRPAGGRPGISGPVPAGWSAST